MEDKNIQDNVSASLPVKGSGSMLAAARKKQNKTVEEIASELNLAVHQIRTIELDQTDGLPEPTYVRGYIRSYANLLGLDVEKVLLAYLNPNWQKSSKLDEMPRGIGSANERVQSKSFKPVWMALFLLVCGGAAFLWFSGILKEKYDLFVDTDLSQTDYVVLGDDQSNDISIQASANVADEGVDRNFVSTPSEPNNLNNPAGVIAGDLEPNDDADDFVEEGEQSSRAGYNKL